MELVWTEGSCSWSITTYLTVTLLALVFGKFIQFALRPFSAARELCVPYPEIKPCIGHLHLMIEKGTPNLDLECYLRYRHQHKAFCTTIFSKATLIACDVQLIKEILVKHFRAFSDREVPNINTRPVDRGLIFIGGDLWKSLRSRVSPAFSSKKMRKMSNLVLGATKNMVKRLKKEAKLMNEISMKELFGGYTLDVVASTMFGLNLDSQNTPDDPFVHHAKTAFKVNMTNPFLLLGILFPSLGPFIRSRGLGFISHKSITFFQSVIQRALAIRKHANDESYADFLQTCMNEEVSAEKIDRQQLSDGDTYRYSSLGLLREDIEAQAVSFFLAGYETTATSLTLLSYIMAVHQDVQQKIRNEINEVLRDEEPTYDNVKGLIYMDMCICESLRLFPPSVRVTRRCTETIQICGLKITEGTSVSIPVYALHRDPDIWPKPDSFIPERFTAEARAARNPYYYLPFGLGPRQCVGMRLALLEMKVGVAQLVRNFRLLPAQGTVPIEELELASTGLLAPKHEIKLKVEPVKH